MLPLKRSICRIGSCSERITCSAVLRTPQTSGAKLKDLKHQQKLALRWTTRLKKTGIEKGTASINELKSMIPEAASIRVDLADDIRVLKQATCSYCICNRPGEDLGSLVDCKKCGEGYHQICMGINEAKAAALEASDEGFKCIRCRISSLFTSAEQAMLTAMKRWMPSTCFAEQAGFNEAPLANTTGAFQAVPVASLVLGVLMLICSLARI